MSRTRSARDIVIDQAVTDVTSDLRSTMGRTPLAPTREEMVVASAPASKVPPASSR